MTSPANNPNISFDIKLDVNQLLDGTLGPITKPTVDVIALLPRAIKVLLSPLDKYLLQADSSFERTSELIAEEILKEKAINLCSPEPYVVVPAIQDILYCMDRDEIRSLYAKLLAKAINRDTKDMVHPAFVGIIKQLHPEETFVLGYLNKSNGFPMVRIYEYIVTDDSPKSPDLINHNYMFTSFGVIKRNHSSISELSMIPQERLSTYIENLVRLGMIEVNYAEGYDHESYTDFLCDPYLLQLKSAYESIPDRDISVVNGHCKFTDFGQAFAEVCL